MSSLTRWVLAHKRTVAAGWGAVVLIWQHGYGSELIWDIPATGSIPSWVPLMAFAFLFVPAVIALMGRWNRWLPAWPARVLRVEPSLPRRTAASEAKA